MTPKFKKALRKTIVNKQVGLITLDIFDTVLFHSVEHENVNFWEVSQKFAKYFDGKITPEYIYLLRLSAREYLDEQNNHEPNALQISSWVVKRIARDHDLSFSVEEIEKLTNDYIKIELAILKNELKVNLDLINFVKGVKEEWPLMKVYFISDMYLRNEDIVNLLSFFQIDKLFDGGYVSSEKNIGKYTGKAFIELIKKYPESKKYFPYNQLHLGDNYVSDFKSPSKLGINSIHLKPNKTKSILRIDKSLDKINNKIEKYYKSNLNLILSNSFGSDSKRIKSQTREYVSFLIGLCFTKYIFYLLEYSVELNKKTYLLSREGSYIKKLISLTSVNQENYIVLPDFNRRNLLRYLLVESIIKSKSKTTVNGIIDRFKTGEISNYHSLDVIDAIGLRPELITVPRSVLTKNPTEKMILFLDSFVKSKNFHKNKSILRDSWLKIHKDLERYNILQEDFVIADVGWGGTIQKILLDIADLNGREIKIDGVYIGTNISDDKIYENTKPIKKIGVVFSEEKNREVYNLMAIEEIWENIISNNKEDIISPVVNDINNKLTDFFKTILKDPKLPIEFIFKKEEKNIIELFKYPSYEVAKLMANILHDLENGYKSVKRLPIINTDRSLRNIIKLLIFKRAEFRNIINSNYWPRGAIGYYRLSTLYKLYSLIKPK